MKINFDISKTLDELEGVDSGEPTYMSSLVITAHRLRKTPLKDWTPQDITRMLGQQMSLIFLVPLAINLLHEDPLLDGMWYPGDLFKILCYLPHSVWETQLKWQEEFDAIMLKAINQVKTDADPTEFTKDLIEKSIQNYQNQ